MTAAVALCRTFIRLMSKGRLIRTREDDANEAQIVKWLRERYVEYLNGLGKMINLGEVGIHDWLFISRPSINRY